MIKFRDKGDRDDVMTASKRTKPANLYANEDLTPQRSGILFALRHIRNKSNGKIAACGSFDGRVYAYIGPPSRTGRSQRVFIDSMPKLDKLCLRELGVAYSEIARNSEQRT